MSEQPTLFCRGSFVIEYLKYSATALGINLVHPPTDDTELEVVNSCKNCLGYLYFPVWGDSVPDPTMLSQIEPPKIWWNLEDPNHFNTFVRQAEQADIILTSASEMMETYHAIYEEKPVHVLTWACEPALHYPNEDDPEFRDREFDIVFVGNRYPSVMERVIGERIVLIPALLWARANNKKFGIFGLGDHSQQSWRNLPIAWLAEGVYQGQSNPFEVGDIYRNSTVVLCMNEQTDSPTMCSMRTYEACGCGNIVLSHWSLATENIFGNYVRTSRSAEETETMLDYIFFANKEEPGIPPYWEVTRAVKAFAHVYEHETYSHRLTRLLEFIQEDFA